MNKAEPIKSKIEPTNHSKLVEGTILPKPAPENVVMIKCKDSKYISSIVGFISNLSILYQPATLRDQSILPVISQIQVQKCTNTAKKMKVNSILDTLKALFLRVCISMWSNNFLTSLNLKSFIIRRQAIPKEYRVAWSFFRANESTRLFGNAFIKY